MQQLVIDTGEERLQLLAPFLDRQLGEILRAQRENVEDVVVRRRLLGELADARLRRMHTQQEVIE